MITRTILLASALLAFTVPAASALTASVDFALPDAPHCALPDAVPWCPLGHEDNGTPTDLGDDTLHPSTIVDHINVDVDPGIPGVQPVRFNFSDTEGFEHPVFRTLEHLFEQANDALPPLVRDHFHYYDEEWWFRICVPEPLREVVYPCRFLPLPIYLADFIERDRIHPLPRLGNDTAGTDEIIGMITDFLAGACPPEVRNPAQAVCDAKNETFSQIGSLLQRLLPNVVYHEAVEDFDVNVGSTEDPQQPPSVGPAEGEGLRGARFPGAPGTPLPLGAANPRPLPTDTPPPASTHPEPPSAGEPRPLAAQETHSWTLPGKSTPWFPGLAAAGAGAALLAVALYRRIAGKRMLDHATRQDILALVARRPGITIQQAARTLGRDYKTIQHHVELLIEGHHLAVQRLGRMRKLFPNHGAFTEAQRKALIALQRPGAQRMWRILETHGPMPRRELERRAGLGRTASFECLKALREHGWVRMTTTHDKTIVAANPNTTLPPGGPGTTTATSQSAPRPTHP